MIGGIRREDGPVNVYTNFDFSNLNSWPQWLCDDAFRFQLEGPPCLDASEFFDMRVVKVKRILTVVS